MWILEGGRIEGGGGGRWREEGRLDTLDQGLSVISCSKTLQCWAFAVFHILLNYFFDLG